MIGGTPLLNACGVVGFVGGGQYLRSAYFSTVAFILSLSLRKETF